MFFIFQNITENGIKNAILEQQKQRQIESIKSIAQHIGSDLESVMVRLQSMANSIYFQNNFSITSNAKELVKENYNNIDNIVDRLGIVDRNNTIVINIVPVGEEDFIGLNLKYNWIKRAHDLKKPIFSEGFRGLDGSYRIGLAYPIIKRDTNEYLGMIVAVIPTERFFAHYGNVHEISSRFLVVFDKNGVMLANGAGKDLVGKNFFGDYTQRFINYNPILNNLTRSLLEGNFAYGIYDYGKGERITVQQPIYVNDDAKYFIQYVQPTQQIYSQIDGILFSQRVEMFILLAAFSFAVIIIIAVYIQWNKVIRKAVNDKTEKLEEFNQNLKESNINLEKANEQLKEYQKIQKDFINVAAHELRTPTQAISGNLELIEMSFIPSILNYPSKQVTNINQELENMIKDKEKLTGFAEGFASIYRNSKRLEKLVKDMLDVTRIEDNRFVIQKEYINLNEKIKNVIKDIYKKKHDIADGNANGNKIIFETAQDPITVFVDKIRIFEVLSNLINNAIKFSNNEPITIKVDIVEKNSMANIIDKEEKQNNDNKEMVVVSIKDQGKGIDLDILPHLFEKFRTKSEGGTGLGLFISKSIIESHGGQMWAYNNKDGKGATFSFSLPFSTFD